MKKLVYGVAIAASLLVLTGCGDAVYGRPGNLTDVRIFKEFSEVCADAGGRLEEGPRDWYTCDMGGAG